MEEIKVKFKGDDFVCFRSNLIRFKIDSEHINNEMFEYIMEGYLFAQNMFAKKQSEKFAQ